MCSVIRLYCISFFLTADGKKDVVFLIDGSDRNKESFSSMQNFILLLAETLNLEQNRDRISVVQYSDKATVDFFLNTHFSGQDEVIDTIKQLRHKGGELLFTGAALQYVKDNVFSVLSGSRRLEGVPQILVLLTAGRSRDDVRGPVKALKEIGVFPLSIGTPDADTLELQTISYQPNYFFIVNFDNLFTIKEDVWSLIKEASNKQVAISFPLVFGKRWCPFYSIYIFLYCTLYCDCSYCEIKYFDTSYSRLYKKRCCISCGWI